jgi:predicted short-subunit dehydrogenase-like oxidoreductase (DUF2520 family)
MVFPFKGMNQSKNFVCIGAGKVATHIVCGLCNSGYNLIQVYSRTIDSAKSLADQYSASYISDPSKLNINADFYLLSLPDQFLLQILEQINVHDKLIFHTAGSHGLEVFGNRFSQFGILYPLQTISKHVQLNIAEVPFLIEACDDKALKDIEKIARSISENVLITDSETRKWIHLAAIFANNFTNHMITLSYEILQQKNLSPSLLRPLIEETYRKSIAMDPAKAQTGPALRNDTVIINKHIKMLEGQSLLQKIYTFTSQSIHLTKISKNKSCK